MLYLDSNEALQLHQAVERAIDSLCATYNATTVVVLYAFAHDDTQEQEVVLQRQGSPLEASAMLQKASEDATGVSTFLKEYNSLTHFGDPLADLNNIEPNDDEQSNYETT